MISAEAKYETGFGILNGLRRPPGRARLCAAQLVQIPLGQDDPFWAAYEAYDVVLNGGGSSRGKYPLSSSAAIVTLCFDACAS
jgi:hypothetical protein